MSNAKIIIWHIILIENSILLLMIVLIVNMNIKYVSNILYRLQGNLIQCMGWGVEHLSTFWLLSNKSIVILEAILLLFVSNSWDSVRDSAWHCKS